MKMKKIITLMLVIIMTFTGVANLFAISQAAVLFLLISPGARSAGMGESFVAIADDATAVYWNPAGLAFQTGREVTFMHANWLPGFGAATSDMYYEFLAYRQYFESLGGTLGANVTFLNLGEMNETSEDGPQILSTFNSWDLAVSLSYATKLGENLGLGVGMRYIRSNLAPIGAGEEKGIGVGTAFAVDLGVLYKFGFINGLSFGMNLSNMGPKITYIDKKQADPLPTNLKIGFAYKALDTEFNRLVIAVETNKLLVHGRDDFFKAMTNSFSLPFREQARSMISSIGLEYVYNNMISLRTGYYYDEEGQVKYPAFGAGLQYAAYRFDFAYVAAKQGHPLADTMRFSLTAGF
ncbi:PorV/PorQ family protein [bacterium]|nr:PorV/PorQ family protein [bacterium]